MDLTIKRWGNGTEFTIPLPRPITNIRIRLAAGDNFKSYHVNLIDHGEMQDKDCTERRIALLDFAGIKPVNSLMLCVFEAVGTYAEKNRVEILASYDSKEWVTVASFDEVGRNNICNGVVKLYGLSGDLSGDPIFSNGR